MKFLQSFLALVLFTPCGLVVNAQLQPHSRYEGVMYPVLLATEDYLYVSMDGKRRRTSYSDVEVRSGDLFGEGYAEISNITYDLDPLKDASDREKRKINAKRFKYSADVVSDRNLKNCYALLTYVSNGSIGTHFEKVGNLSKGKIRTIDIENKSTVDAVGSLHIFSETLEIKTNQNNQPFTLAEYSERLTKQGEGVPAVVLVESERNYDHVLSPDGKYIATRRDRDTHYTLLVYDVETLGKVLEENMGEYDEGIWDVNWISNTDLAFIFAGDLHVINVHEGIPENIKENVRQIMGQSRERPQVLSLMRYESGRGSFMTTYDALEKEVVGVEEFGYGTSYIDYQGVPRVRKRDINGKQIWFVKPTPESHWVELDKHSKLENVKFNMTGDEMIEQDILFHSIGHDGDTIYVSTRHDSDTYKLAEFSLSKGEITKTIAGLSTYDMRRGNDGHSNFLFHKTSGQLLGIVYEASKMRVSWLDPHCKDVQKAMDATFPDSVNWPVDWSADGSTFIYYTRSDKHPGIYYLFRPFESKLVPLINFGKELEGYEMGSMKPIKFKSRDGATIYGYITLPPGYDGETPLPTIVDIHGGPAARDSWGFNSTNQFFATRGYAVLNVNFRGSSGYGKQYQEKGLFSRLDTIVIDDVVDGVNYCIEQGWTNEEKVGVMGASFGGWATYLCIIRYPELFKAGVPIAAVSSWRESLSEDRWKEGIAYRYWRSILNANDFKEDEPHIEPIKRAGEINRPLYIMHGNRDSIVPVEHTEDMVRALEKNDKEFDVMYFPLASHSYWPDSSRITRLNQTENFFRKHLGLVDDS